MGQIWTCLRDALPQRLREAGALEPLEPNSDAGARSISSDCHKRVLIASDGSQGDVQPLVPLARRLTGLGHEVCVVTNADHVPFLEEHGICALATWPSKRAVFEEVKCNHMMFVNMARTEAVANAWRRAHPGAVMSLDAAVRDFEPDLIMSTHQSHPPLTKYVRETGVPLVIVWLIPSKIRRYIHGFDSFANWDSPFPVLLATSPLLDHAQPHLEGLSNVLQTGAWVDEPSDQDLRRSWPADSAERQRLTAFLAEGPPPVAIGWGSMVLKHLSSVQLVILVLQVVRESGRRAVVLGGWARLEKIAQDLLDFKDVEGLEDLDDEELEELVEIARDRCCFVSSAPHMWLFPQCSCVVHHGGSGTTQAVVRCGRPCVITPVWIDQFWWAKTVARLRIGVGFDQTLEYLEYPAGRIASAIKRAELMAPKARELGELFRAEDGVGCAVRELQRLLEGADD